MSVLDQIDEHITIRETVGYEFLNNVPIEDIPAVLHFLKVIKNYNRLCIINETTT